MRGIAVLLVTCAACGGGGGATGDAAPVLVIDAAPDGGGGIIDCWESRTCQGGSVYTTYGSDSSTDPTCGYRVAYVCPEGCDAEGASYWDTEADFPPEQLCAGVPDVVAGAPCYHLGRPCWPTHAATQPDGSVTQAYLTCDASFTCVATTAPAVAQWLAPCAGVTVPSGFRGVMEGGYYGVCLAEDDGAGCTITATTTRCNGDWDCPDGASCDSSLVETYDFGAVCRPGPRGAPLGLGC